MEGLGRECYGNEEEGKPSQPWELLRKGGSSREEKMSELLFKTHPNDGQAN